MPFMSQLEITRKAFLDMLKAEMKERSEPSIELIVALDDYIEMTVAKETAERLVKALESVSARLRLDEYRAEVAEQEKRNWSHVDSEQRRDHSADRPKPSTPGTT